MRQLIVLILVLFTCPTFVFAQDAAPTIKDVMDADEKTDAVIADSRADEDIRPGDTPLSTVLAIVDAGREGDWQGAGEHLDMRYLPPDMAEADAATLMEQLSIVWGQQRILDLTRLSSDPAGHLDDDLPSYRDKIGTISLVDETMPLYLQRVPGENGRRVWKISNATVQQIPMLWEQFGYNPAITHR